LRAETLRRYGLSPESTVQAMALSRKKALERLQGLEEAVLYHFDDHIPSTIGKAPTAVNHWRKEVGGFLDQMEALSEHVGGKTSAEWRARISELRSRLAGLLGDER
jgi:hypothetical protein